jgi:DNA-binding Lrp family transcriptional regulator
MTSATPATSASDGIWVHHDPDHGRRGRQQCHRVTGEDCYIVRAHVRDVLHLEEVIYRFTVLGQTTTSIMQSAPVPGRPLDLS